MPWHQHFIIPRSANSIDYWTYTFYDKNIKQMLSSILYYSELFVFSSLHFELFFIPPLHLLFTLVWSNKKERKTRQRWTRFDSWKAWDEEWTNLTLEEQRDNKDDKPRFRSSNELVVHSETRQFNLGHRRVICRMVWWDQSDWLGTRVTRFWSGPGSPVQVFHLWLKP